MPAKQDLYDPNFMVQAIAGGEAVYPKVETGADFRDETLVISRQFQNDMLDFCDIDPALYGDEVDLGLLARRPISIIGSALFDHHHERGYVHTVQQIERILPIHVDTPVAMSGQFTKIEDHPRGWLMHARFEYRLENGDLALIVSPIALMADPERNTAAPPKKSGPQPTTADRMADLAAEGWQDLKSKTCTPENVVGYCGSTRNLIHTDPAYAKTFGFRAPITAGNQMINWHLEAAKLAAPAEKFEGEVRLLRPVFWDDAITMMTRKQDAVLEIIAVKDDGRIANRSQFRSKG